MQQNINPEDLMEKRTPLQGEVVTENPYQLLVFGYQHKLADRYCQTFLFHHRFRGEPILLVVNIEIINPWHPAREVGTSLAQTISRELMRAESPSLIIRFEQSLKAANQFIALQSQRINTPIHCAAALFYDREVHFSGIGDGVIILARRGQSSRISPQQTGDQDFSVVTSGDLQDDDWLLVGSTNSGDSARTAIAFAERGSIEDDHASNHELVANGPWSGALVRYAPIQAVQETIYFDALKTYAAANSPSSGGISTIFTTIKKTALIMARQIEPAMRLVIKIVKRIPLPKFIRTLPKRHQQLAAVVVTLLLVIWAATALYSGRQSSAAPTANAPTNRLLQALSLTDTDLSIYLAKNFSFSDYQALDGNGKRDVANRLQEAQINPVGLSKPVATLANSGIAIDRFGETAYVLDITGQIWLVGDSAPKAVTQSQLITQPVTLAAFSPEKLVVSDQAGNIWLVNSVTGNTTTLSLPSAIQTGIKLIQNFENNLYLYATASGDFYRVANFSNDLSKAALYTKKDTLPLEAVVDFAVNGQLMAIDQTGKIQDFSRNQLGSFATSIDQAVVAAPLHLDTQADSTHAVIAADRQLITYPKAKADQKTTSFIFSEDQLTDIAQSASSIWLLIDKEIYQLIP